MPTSATGRKADGPVLGCGRAVRGFSLIEILVVIVVIGVLVSIFSLSVGGFVDDQGAEDMRRLEALIDLAAEEAAMQGREIGLTFYQHGYEFSARATYYDEDGNRYQIWEVLDQDRVLRPRDLGEDVAVDLVLDRDEAVLQFERDTEAQYQPQIYILSSGEIEPPFAARFRPTFESEGYRLEAETNGELSVTDEISDAG